MNFVFQSLLNPEPSTPTEVQRLLSLRADIDEPFRQETLTPLGIYMKVLSLQHLGDAETPTPNPFCGRLSKPLFLAIPSMSNAQLSFKQLHEVPIFCLVELC